MKVYVVVRVHCVKTYVVGVYPTLERAMAVCSENVDYHYYESVLESE